MKNKLILILALIFVLVPQVMAEGLVVSPNDKNISVGSNTGFIVTSGGGTYTWTSSVPSVATVDSNGLATGLDHGTTTITAGRDGDSGTATLNVYEVNRDINVGSGGVVTVNLTGYGDFRVFWFEELIPDGFEVIETSPNVNMTGNEFVGMVNSDTGFDATYVIRPVSSGTIGLFSITGNYSNGNKGDINSVQGSITGDYEFVLSNGFEMDSDTNHDGRIDRGEVLNAVVKYFEDEYRLISIEDIFKVVWDYFNGTVITY